MNYQITINDRDGGEKREYEILVAVSGDELIVERATKCVGEAGKPREIRAGNVKVSRLEEESERTPRFGDPNFGVHKCREIGY